MSTKAIVLFAVVCLFVIVKVSSAWEAKPCEGFEGKLISLTVNNCPDQTRDRCEIMEGEELSWDVKFTSGITFEKVWTGYTFDGFSAWNPHYEQPGKLFAGKKGETKNYHFEIEFGVRATEGDMDGPLKLVTVGAGEELTSDNTVVCAEIPVRFVKRNDDDLNERQAD